MTMRVPLLAPSAVLISRLSPTMTSRVDPDGAGPIVGGYDPILREPYPYEDTTQTTASGEEKAVTTVRYSPHVRIPCQVEIKTFEELRQTFSGDAPVTNMVFVLHNKDLKRLGLLFDGDAGCNCVPKLKTNDRIDRVEVLRSPGTISHPFKEKLFVFRIDPGSWGMGPSGQDLQIVWTSNRPATPAEVGQ